MFWTAFIWGIGVSFGASFGVLFLAIMLCFVVAFCTSDRVKKSTELAEAANAALLHRNELTEKQIEMITKAHITWKQSLIASESNSGIPFR